MITRQQMEIINRKTLRYPLHIAEKDYLLALVLQHLAKSPLGEKLVFKGGTAVHHCYLEQQRFSEDLDFSTGGEAVSLEEIREVLTAAEFLEIRKDYQSDATIKIERLLYTGPLGHPNSLKVEIDFKQNVLLPPQHLSYQNVWGVDFPVRVMDAREICAEKIRAMSERARYRDFYDLYMLLETRSIELGEVAGYAEQKEMRQPISKESIRRNWQILAAQKGSEAQQIYLSQPIDDRQIESLIDEMPFETLT